MSCEDLHGGGELQLFLQFWEESDIQQFAPDRLLAVGHKHVAGTAWLFFDNQQIVFPVQNVPFITIIDDLRQISACEITLILHTIQCQSFYTCACIS